LSKNLFSLFDEWGPQKVVCVSDPKTGMRGVLVIDNTARGMGKGGTRMSNTLSVTEVARLARTMTWKWAAVDLFYGGAKAGILGDPNAAGKEALLRSFARALQNEVPREYVLGLDMGLSERDAAIFNDELGDRGAAVGLPESLGGVPYDELGVTGFGVAEAADAAVTSLGGSIKDKRVAVQGFGAVGVAAARRLHEMGACVVAIATALGTVYEPRGLDVPLMVQLQAEKGDACVNACDSQPLPSASILLLDTDVLIAAAREDVIDEAVARDVRAQFIVEGANMPTTHPARTVLMRRGVTVVPDFIANSGGAVAAAYAMEARYSAFRPQTEGIFSTVRDKTRNNTVAVLETSRSRGIGPHAAALGLAQDRVAAAMEARGWGHPRGHSSEQL
jgi:glutamate dehydrogenase (NAD(P)+)